MRGEKAWLGHDSLLPKKGKKRMAPGFTIANFVPGKNDSKDAKETTCTTLLIVTSYEIKSSPDRFVDGLQDSENLLSY